MSKDSKTKSSKGKDVAIEDMYKKKSQREHIYDLPDTYIGSIEQDEQMMWVYDNDKMQIVYKLIKYVPGFYKIFDEVMVNAADHESNKSNECDEIRINVDKDAGKIKVWNNGKGIRVEMHEKEKVYAPELIFGHLLTSGNYDQKGKTTGGKNGLGSKISCIFSTKFIVKTVDMKNKKKYVQVFENNMSVINKPEITDVDKDEEPYTEITFYPDFERFGMKKGLTDDVISLLKKRAYDLSVCTREKTKVYFNDELIKTKSFEDFIKLHYEKEPNLVYKKFNDRWRVGVVFAPDAGNNHVSFVNRIWTYQGGTHVEYINKQIVDKIKDRILKKQKTLNIKPMQIKEHLSLFVDSIIDDPSFSSQSKGELTTKVSNFGTTCEIDDAFITSLEKMGIVDLVINYAVAKVDAGLKTAVTVKKGESVKDIPKLDDAEWAGSRRKKETRLILTEGDSAKPFAVEGLTVLGRQKFGVFPLKGKLINVRNATPAQLMNNEEFKNLMKILGLKTGVSYKDASELRYGGIIILTDQDVDGSHIKGLLINMIQYFWPDLLSEMDGYINTLATPLLKITKKGKPKNPVIKTFYNQQEYDDWVKNEMKGDVSGWEHPKYYKGLGTSTSKEAREIWNNYNDLVIKFIWDKVNPKDAKSDDDEEQDDAKSVDSKQKKTKKIVVKGGQSKNKSIVQSKSYDAISLAFEKTRADDRKEWLKEYKKDEVLKYNGGEISFSNFINKELIHFSNEDNIRSIPSIMDGFKPSQRKIMFCMFEHIEAKFKEIKVAQFASKVAEKTAYKHGEASLQGAIVNIAQKYVGANNIYLLHPQGNFGTRAQLGKNFSSPRYIFTYLEKIVPYIFKKEDESILNYIIDEGDSVEPEYYLPIIPMILVNGSIGIGTGYSTDVPPFNPLDIIYNVKRKLNSKEMKEMTPWYNGFTGTIKKHKSDNQRFIMSGKYNIVDGNTVRITELPVGIATDDYIVYLNGLVIDEKKNPDGHLTNYPRNRSGNNDVNIEVDFKNSKIQKILKSDEGELEKILKMTTTISTTNMHMYNHKHVLTKYNSPLDVINEYYEVRLRMYEVRRQKHLRVLNNELEILRNKVKFIKEIAVTKTLDISHKKKDVVYVELEKRNYSKLSHDLNALAHEKDYAYLTGMQLMSLTTEKIDELTELYNMKKKEFDDYNTTTAQKLWERELDELADYYDKWLVMRENEDIDDPKEKPKKEKTTEKSKSKN